MSIKRNLRAVEYILADVWDPIGTAGSGEPRDEYASYAPRIFELLHRGAAESEIAAELARIENDELGLGPCAPAERLEVAAAIRASYDAAAS